MNAVERCRALLDKSIRGINKIMVRILPLPLLTGLRPLKVDCKLVGEGDGAWSIPTDCLSEESLCYCFGVGEDISFDLGLSQLYQCQVYSFDPTPSSIKYIESCGRLPITFEPWGIYHKDTLLSLFPQSKDSRVNLSTIYSHRGQKLCDIECYRLVSIMKMLGHSKVDLIKIDIEGAWPGVVEDIVSSGVAPRILCIEFDSPTSVVKVQKAMRLLKSVGLHCVSRLRDDYLFVNKKLL